MRRNQDLNMFKFAVSLSSKLQYCHTEVSFTQKQLSELLNVERSCISHYESGNVTPSIYYIFKFSKIFNIDLYDLLNTDFNLNSFKNKYSLEYFYKHSNISNIKTRF